MGYIRPIWIVCLLSLFSAFFFNYLNLHFVPETQLRNGSTIITNDDLSYIRPAEEFYQNGTWKDKMPGDISYFHRPPGYGIIYYCCLLLSESHALTILKIFQILLFTLSVYCLFKIGVFIIKNDKGALIAATIYGITPFAMGFLSYTLTEGITPAFVIIYLYFLIKGYTVYHHKAKNLHFTLASLVFAFLFITRPVLGILGLLLPVFIIYSYNRWFKKIFIFGLIAGSFMTIWQFRNYRITNEFIGLHPIYYQDHNSIYRPTFKAFWNFALGWNEDVPKVHGYMIPFWKNTLKGNDSVSQINNIVNQLPEEVTQHFGKERLVNIFKDYQKAILVQKPYYENGLAMPKSIIPEEQKVVEEFDLLTKEYKQHFWFNYYVISPLKVLKNMAFHSNLSMYMFQQTFRGNYIMEFFRIIFFALHSLCFIALIFILLPFKIDKEDYQVRFSIFFSVFIYIAYLAFFQRGIEERYTLPILPILLVGLIYSLNYFLQLFRK